MDIDFYAQRLEWIQHDEQENTCEKRGCNSVLAKFYQMTLT